MSIVSPAQSADGQTINASNINNPVNTIANDYNGNITNANVSASAAIDGSKLAASTLDLSVKASNFDGWVTVTDSWTYSSATTITVPSDATTKYSVGDKIRITNGGLKYFYITAVAATTLTITGGTDYTLTNVAISAISYSKVVSPLNFPQWFNYTPTWTNLTVGNATQAAQFVVIGKTVHVNFSNTFGTTTVVGTDPTFTLPVTSATTSYSSNSSFIGTASWTGSGLYPLNVLWNSSTLVLLNINLVNATYASTNSISATVPVAYAASYRLAGTLTYQLP